MGSAKLVTKFSNCLLCCKLVVVSWVCVFSGSTLVSMYSRTRLSQMFKKDLVLNTNQNDQLKENTFCFEQLICQCLHAIMTFYLSCYKYIDSRLFLLILSIRLYNPHICILNMADMLRHEFNQAITLNSLSCVLHAHGPWIP